MEASIEQLLKTATKQLDAVSESPVLDAELLLAHALDKNRTYLIAFSETIPTPQQQQAFDSLIKRRLEGEPVAHLLGQREFWSLNLSVDKHTLIPRPDTELLVEFILEQFPGDQLKLADLGTGSGAIALALASEKPRWQITATDQSDQALAVAKQNASALQLDQVQFRSGSWFDALNENDFDIIVSNPPYIPANDPHLATGDVRFEPASALVAGEEGLDDIGLLIKRAPGYLQSKGWLILEHGYDQQAAVKKLFESAGYRQITQRNDYGNNPRMSAAQRPA